MLKSSLKSCVDPARSNCTELPQWYLLSPEELQRHPYVVLELGKPSRPSNLAASVPPSPDATKEITNRMFAAASVFRVMKGLAFSYRGKSAETGDDSSTHSHLSLTHTS